ncbi:ABC-2 type transport system permease protein [Microbacteriaceae bacterium SG_E_30_P1]|uniref:Transport permease protein n=1 Tax=Antiquaquibacter oligotrophicus TaxID=2880260 RepID=A0ABT6KR91_9MICO|nr:ABC transporter permease [Antiquaquibacter oligotrophicus]MDH6181719.1 ABC-2 type transport system permease protein [Antiquaquibacter oligotrophicus]UDF12598.1 ABC transporter permease [Antiquaquibacter oligotrophicus]
MNAHERYAMLEREPFRQVGGRSQTVKGSFDSIADVFRHREMLGLLVRRDLKSRYKDSALGFLWTLVRPLTQLAIYYVVIGHFLGAARGIPDFAIYVFTGLTAYTLFAEIVSTGTSSIVSNAGLIKKVQLPREVFPLASVGSALFNFAIQLGILLVAALILGVFPAHWDLLYAIPSLVLLVTVGTALALLLSAWNVYLRDIGYLLEVVLMVMLWASPIVYAFSMVKSVLGPSILLEIYTNNPLTLAVLGFQKAFWVGGNGSAEFPPAEYPDQLLLRMLIAIGISLVFLVISQRVFTRLQGNFAQEL